MLKLYFEDSVIELGKSINDPSETASSWERDKSGGYTPDKNSDPMEAVAIKMGITKRDLTPDFVSALNAANGKFDASSPDLLIYTPEPNVAGNINKKFPGYYVRFLAQVKDEQGNSLGVWATFTSEDKKSYMKNITPKTESTTSNMLDYLLSY